MIVFSPKCRDDTVNTLKNDRVFDDNIKIDDQVYKLLN